MADGGDEVVYTGPRVWFSSDQTRDEGPLGWRLDVVTLLAVIGESSIADHAQTITASMMCLLPRIIPAPQALLKPSRPLRLPEVNAKMTGVYSGVTLDTVGFFANILHPLDELQPFSFKVLEITHADRNNAGGAEVGRPVGNEKKGVLERIRSIGRTDTATSDVRLNRLPGPPSNGQDDITAPASTTGFNPPRDVEAGPQQGITRRFTVKEKVQDFVANPTLANNAKRPAVPPNLYSPLHILTVFSVLVTIGMIIAAAFWNDGSAILSVSLLSLASSVVGLASWWRPLLMSRSHTNKVPKGDVLIRTREGGFLLIKCTEEVARELYAGTEECDYRVGGQAYQALMGFGTLLLMVGVVLLGNCKWNSQIFIGAAYITLNALYWGMSLIPKKYFWDLSRYKLRDVPPPEAQNAHMTTDPNDQREGVKSFTRTLWYAIRETKRTAWVERSGAAPSTLQWQLWLREAEAAANSEDKKWPAVARKDEIMKMDADEIMKINADKFRWLGGLSLAQPTRPFDEAGQQAPAVEVQHPPSTGQTQ
ncbi:hypothetical protein DL770_010070 [Monosporascus sp. CRB-9-2]|nr:hypothetical protein DL770_010070 [Monosporascus sp. CRB-9-2]